MEAADELKMVTLPIPSEQRADVYIVTPAVQADAELGACWLRQGGASTFHKWPQVTPENAATFCGVALFTLDNPHCVPDYIYRALRPFFERAGRESNVFEFCPIQKNFTRRDCAWLSARVYSCPVTGCPAPVVLPSFLS